KETIKLVEDVRASMVSQELRISYLAAVREYYELYVDLLMQLHERRPWEGFDAAALRASEQARARSLLEMLAEARADIRQGVDPKLVERERQLQQQLNAKASQQTRLFSRKETLEQASAAAKEIAMLTDQYGKIEAQIRAASPRYAALTQPQPLSVTEIQRLLDEDTLLLEYSLGKERSYLWAVTPASIASYQLPKRAEIGHAAGRVYDLLTARNLCISDETYVRKRARVKSADAQFTQAASALSRMLLGPVAAELGTKRLLVITQGALQFISFAALPAPQGQQPVNGQKPRRAKGGLPATGYRPLLVEHEIVNLPSASVLAALRRDTSSRPAAPKTAAVFADPVFTEDDERVQMLASTTANARSDRMVISSRRAQSRDIERALEDVSGSCPVKGIPRLSGTRWEAEHITALARPRQRLLALDFAANRATATSPDLGQYRILHFATHALINSTHP